jgi:hypothetical protein
MPIRPDGCPLLSVVFSVGIREKKSNRESVVAPKGEGGFTQLRNRNCPQVNRWQFVLVSVLSSASIGQRICPVVRESS